MTINGRNKGKRGEHEAIRMLQSVVEIAYAHVGIEPPVLERNLTQTRGGGYDIDGLDFLAIEVKRVEVLALNRWWGQCVRQTGEGQTPFLMWRQNRKPWMAQTVVITDEGCRIVVAMEWGQAERWLKSQIIWRLQYGGGQGFQLPRQEVVEPTT